MTNNISPTPACADRAGNPVVSTVSTGTAGDTLRMMRAEYNALDRWLSAYRHLVAVNERAKDDLEWAIGKLEKEVEG